jgi:hypothetical protein
MTDLTKAIAELRRVTPPNSPWEAGDIGAGSSPVDYHIATTLNAVLSGDLVPRADADLAVALMVEKAATHVRTAEVPREETGEGAMQRALLNYAADVVSLCAPASALAELQALRDARTARTGDRATDFDNDAVYQFSKLMKDKMAKSRAKGRKGWNDPTQCSPDFLRHLLYEHIYKGDPVDVANLCMMLRHYDEPTTPKPEDDLRLLHAEAAEAELVTLRAQVERLTGALTIAANRLHRCSVDYDTGTREFIEVGEWADEARAAITEGAAPSLPASRVPLPDHQIAGFHRRL